MSYEPLTAVLDFRYAIADPCFEVFIHDSVTPP